jgi:hypothetical protein
LSTVSLEKGVKMASKRVPAKKAATRVPAKKAATRVPAKKAATRVPAKKVKKAATRVPAKKAKKAAKRVPAAQQGGSASQLIDSRISELGDWRGETLSRIRSLIKQVDPEAVEEWKWRGTPVWSHDGIICTGETYKSVVKLTFAKGASLTDPAGLFNSSLDGNVRRAIDILKGDQINQKALGALLRDAIALNTSSRRR